MSKHLVFLHFSHRTPIVPPKETQKRTVLVRNLNLVEHGLYCMFGITANLSSRNLVSIPTSEFVKPGLLYNMLLRKTPLNFAEQSKSTLIFPVLWGYMVNTMMWYICNMRQGFFHCTDQEARHVHSPFPSVLSRMDCNHRATCDCSPIFSLTK